MRDSFHPINSHCHVWQYDFPAGVRTCIAGRRPPKSLPYRKPESRREPLGNAGGSTPRTSRSHCGDASDVHHHQRPTTKRVACCGEAFPNLPARRLPFPVRRPIGRVQVHRYDSCTRNGGRPPGINFRTAAGFGKRGTLFRQQFPYRGNHLSVIGTPPGGPPRRAFCLASRRHRDWSHLEMLRSSRNDAENP